MQVSCLLSFQRYNWFAGCRQAQEAANASSQEGELVSKKNRGRPPGSRNRAHEEKYTTPAANAAEAVKRLFASSKNVSKKFNEEVVSQLYNQMDENAQPSAVSRYGSSIHRILAACTSTVSLEGV